MRRLKSLHADPIFSFVLYVVWLYIHQREGQLLNRWTPPDLFSETRVRTAAFVLIIIAVLRDESLISPNKSSFQGVKKPGAQEGDAPLKSNPDGENQRLL